MFYSIKELVEQAELDFQGNVAELMITTEYELTGREREEVLLLMERNHEFCDISLKVQFCLLDQFFDRIKHASSYLKKLTL